ncbi:hypothetical protein AAG570_000504 [Ranatra chinensis]|uniref:Replication factor Mcm10 C-terminal domain-containing protein n=1 Tax=Ranatra chinensis TaxID=642074 RepID=A0ABD0YXA0_9HEMI
MNRPAVNEELVIHNETKRFDEYYEKMEKKEQMEEKMLNTFKIECKAVKCLECKYTWFSASEMCKSEGHPIKVVDAEKRFFKCGKCSNRTISLEIIPLISCRNCGSSNWLKAPMIRVIICIAYCTC